MSKQITRESHSGRFVIGRRSAEKFSAVEGQFHTQRTLRIQADSEAAGESGDALRARIRAEFTRKK
jgi:hypothetical protein